jgi:hypothetical protein
MENQALEILLEELGLEMIRMRGMRRHPMKEDTMSVEVNCNHSFHTCWEDRAELYVFVRTIKEITVDELTVDS